MRYLNERKLWTKEYYRHIYRKLLDEIEESISYCSPKWKRDLLLMLLQHTYGNAPSRKSLRKIVAKDVKRAEVIAYNNCLRLEELTEG